jgi:hypothetical protein
MLPGGKHLSLAVASLKETWRGYQAVAWIEGSRASPGKARP